MARDFTIHLSSTGIARQNSAQCIPPYFRGAVSTVPTSKTVRQLALALPKAEERPSYGTPGFFVCKKIFARLLPDEDLVVLKIDFDRRDVLMKSDPKSYFITDHYRNYPMMIVRLSSVDRPELKELLENAWQFASE